MAASEHWGGESGSDFEYESDADFQGFSSSAFGKVPEACSKGSVSSCASQALPSIANVDTDVSDSWSCVVCTYSKNVGADGACRICESSRAATSPIEVPPCTPTSSSNLAERTVELLNWNCGSCTLLNYAENMECAACDAPRTQTLSAIGPTSLMQLTAALKQYRYADNKMVPDKMKDKSPRHAIAQAKPVARRTKQYSSSDDGEQLTSEDDTDELFSPRVNSLYKHHVVQVASSAFRCKSCRRVVSTELLMRAHLLRCSGDAFRGPSATAGFKRRRQSIAVRRLASARTRYASSDESSWEDSSSAPTSATPSESGDSSSDISTSQGSSGTEYMRRSRRKKICSNRSTASSSGSIADLSSGPDESLKSQTAGLHAVPLPPRGALTRVEVQAIRAQRLAQLVEQSERITAQLSAKLHRFTQESAGDIVSPVVATDAQPLSVLASLATPAERGIPAADSNSSAGHGQCDEQPRGLSGATLHRYQLDGVRWLENLHRAKLNGILADEMGLGL
jgi:hypothetical protein